VPHFREDFLRQKFLQPDALPCNANRITDQETGSLVAFYNRQDGCSTMLNPAEHGCMQ